MHSVGPVFPCSWKPMIDEDEVRGIVRRYGEPIRRVYDLCAQGTVSPHRWRANSDRRAEVIFAIQGPGEQIWLHTKHNYPRPMFRLPTGGIERDEEVLSALLREIDEETGLSVTIQRFVALLEYRFHSKNQHGENQGKRSIGTFASYIFLVQNEMGEPVCEGNNEVAEFKPILPCQLAEVAANLRNIYGERRAWGHWRAIAHEVLDEALKKQQ